MLIPYNSEFCDLIVTPFSETFSSFGNKRYFISLIQEPFSPLYKFYCFEGKFL